MAKGCGCGHGADGESCKSSCEEIFAYWCDTCKRSVPGKRCPDCGLKARKKKDKE